MNQLIRCCARACRLLLLILAALASTSCIPIAMDWLAGESDPEPSGPAKGLRIVFADEFSRTLVPDVDMTAASYVVTGQGPDAESFSRTTTGGSIDIEELKVGLWNITVEALNAEATVIGMGTGQVTLAAATPATISVKVKPLNGYGTLAITVNWPAADVASPAVTAQLTPASGAARNLAFTLGTGTATSTTTDIPTGYHTLSLQVLDGGVLVAGAIEIVRILKNKTTAGTFTFDQVNPVTANVQVNVDPQLDEPLVVSLAGQQATVVEGTGFTVSASVAGFAGNVVYTWYLNSVFKATGSSFAVPANLEPGFYRMDVTAIAADGSQAGSATASFTVTASPLLTQVTLEWDASTGTNVAGYKVHYGTADGVYDQTVDAGNVLTCTVTGLETGRTYYFVATAYDSTGLESGYSNQVVFNS